MAFNYADRSRDFALLGPSADDSYTLRVTGMPDVVLPAVLTEPITYKQELPADGSVQQGDILCVWPVANSQKPPLGSELIDSAGAAWTILTVLRKQHVETWEATARNLVIANNLNNFAQVLRATFTKSPAGQAVPTWSAFGSPIPARFQPISQDAQIFEDSEWTKTEFTVILSNDILDFMAYPVELAGAAYRLRDAQGRHYRVTSYQQAERIDCLPTATAVLILEGAEGQLAQFSSSSSSSSGS
jgi:hypothetical protein